MIINIAGTSGSGKTFLMRNFITWVRANGEIKPEYIVGRKPPIGYRIGLPAVDKLFLVGSYGDADTAGCDTIRDVIQVFTLVKQAAKKGHVIYEGLIVMNHTRGPQLAAEFGEEFVVLQLTTPFATCIAGINERREQRGDGPLRKKDNTKGNYVRAQNYCTKMRAAGARIIRVGRDEALSELIQVVGS